MPYGGEKTSGQLAKMERCVKELTPKHGKVSAIKMCKKKILTKGGK